MDFNPKAFISRHNYETDADMLEHIISLDTNDDKYNEMLSQPILNSNNKVLDLNRFNTWFDNNVYRGVINK